MPNTVDGPLQVNGPLTCKSFNCPAGALQAAAVNDGAQIEATKLVHQHHREYAQPNTAATAATVTLHVARHAGQVAELVAGSIAKAVGDSTVTFDLKKNNVSILSSTLVLDNANTNRVAEAATLNPASIDYVAGDWFELVVTVSAGTGTLPTGIAANVVFNERSQ